MGRDENRGDGSGEDWLSAATAAGLVAAHLAGGGLMAVLWAFGVPPLMAGAVGPREAAVAWRGAGGSEPGIPRPIPAVGAAGVARVEPADRGRSRR